MASLGVSIKVMLQQHLSAFWALDGVMRGHPVKFVLGLVFKLQFTEATGVRVFVLLQVRLEFVLSGEQSSTS